MIIPRPGASDPLLVVEGQDDLHVIRHLAEHSDPSLTFGIRDYEGIENVLASMNGHIDTSGRPAVGFVVDSDRDVSRTWRRIRGEFLNTIRAIPLPDNPEPNGTIIAGDPLTGDPRIGVWLMPDNTTEGELENFVADMIPTGDSVWPLAQQYIDGIPPMDRKFADNKTLRAQIHAWLAAREDPRQMGLAIRTRDLDVANPLSRRFLDWLSRLFR